MMTNAPFNGGKVPQDPELFDIPIPPPITIAYYVSNGGSFYVNTDNDYYIKEL